ncbi:protein transporter tim10 [Basidiobolus ranarum]|uniref:Mitochondrial import inner membrane translocase subunit n=1 Tax=Basidiobolus ranarum TaxID=34480 RepID=A0ABR2WST8_9FUNG
MNFGGMRGGYQQPQNNRFDPMAIAMAENELDMVTDLYNRIIDSCHKKCISKKYESGELNNEENSCIDHCVAQFFQVNQLVGNKLSGMTQQAMGGK